MCRYNLWTCKGWSRKLLIWAHCWGYYAPSTNMAKSCRCPRNARNLYTKQYTKQFQPQELPQVEANAQDLGFWPLLRSLVAEHRPFARKAKVKRWRLWEGMIRYDCMIGISCMYALLLMILMEEWLRKAWIFSPLRPKLTELYRHIFACLDQDAQTTKEAIPISLRRERPAVGGKHWHWALHGDEMKKGSIYCQQTHCILDSDQTNCNHHPHQCQVMIWMIWLQPSVCVCVCGTGCSIDELAQNISLEVRKQLDAATSIKWWSQFIHSDLAEVHLICYLVQVWTKNWSTERRLV